MEFRVLGPLEVVDGDRIVSLPRRKQRALLAVFLLAARELVSADRLIEDLWGERAPPTARDALQNNVSQLRRALGPDAIVTRPGGYLLDVEPEQIDLGRFRMLADAARSATGNAERAARAREALALWRGPPLSDLVYEPFAAAELPPLEDERLSLRRDLIDAELALGRHADVLDEIEALVHAHPYDERLRCQLMLALYRDGRHVDALAVVHDSRRTLTDELGLEPGRELRSLEQRILNHDPGLDLPSAAEPAVEPVRKSVTVLFAGLPDLEENLDAEALHTRHRRFFAAVKAAAEYHGGTVARLADDRAMAVFGLPAAHEDDALRAVRAAVRAREGDGAGAGYGVATGDVYAERESGSELLVSGDPVIESRQLEQAAAPSEILLAASTLQLVRGQ